MDRLMQIDCDEFLLGGSVLVTDPCYDIGTWCTAQLDNVHPGTWVGHVIKSNEGNWGIRCAELVALHKDHLNDIIVWNKTSHQIGVDSGQAGFFDPIKFETHNMQSSCDFENPKTFYDKCGQATLSLKRFGVIENCGIVTSSGYGDGVYDLYIAYSNNGQIIGLRLVFISDEYIDEQE